MDRRPRRSWNAWRRQRWLAPVDSPRPRRSWHGWDTEHRHQRRIAPADARMMLWTGLLLGLALINISWPDAPPVDPFEVPVEVPDPYAESKRSLGILRLQEGSPPNAFAERGTGGASTSIRGGTARVVDGDTFWLSGQKIRIADIDAPEVAGRCAYETRLAARATRRLDELLAQGGYQLKPIAGRDMDGYGRKLRIVTRAGSSIGDQLVSEGLARTWTGRREPWC